MIPSHDHRVRTFLVCGAALAVVSIAAAGEPTGRVVRVERAPSREVFVPAGTFAMGVTEDEENAAEEACHTTYEPKKEAVLVLHGSEATLCARYHEELEHMRVRDVTLGAFRIDRNEVSVADYRKCVAADACPIDPLVDGDERYLRDDGPMVNVTWFEARELCRWHGERLPTEAEWERAARGDDGRAWPWGKADRPADFNHGRARDEALRDIERIHSPIPIELLGDPDDSDGYAVLAPPGSYAWGEGPYGTRDQAGNAAEWTSDLRGITPETLGYTGLSTIDPHRDSVEHQALEALPRVVRGGSWRQPAYFARANLRDPFHIDNTGSTRQMYLPQQRFSHVGFRCARSL